MFNSIVDKHVPLETISKQQFKLAQKPWIIKGIYNSIKQKRCLYRRYCVNGNDPQKEYYKKYANLLTHTRELSKKQYFKDQIALNKGNTKETWKIIGNIIKLKSKSFSSPVKLVTGHSEYTCDKDIANQFNLHFSNVGPSLSAKIPPSP